VTTLAGLGILIVLLLGAFRTHQPAPTSAAPGSSTSVSPSSGAQSSSAPTPVEVVMIPTAITVNINGGNSGLPEWSPILVAVIGVFGAAGSAFITYFVQRGHKEANKGPASPADH
jgi:hypothetical protein